MAATASKSETVVDLTAPGANDNLEHFAKRLEELELEKREIAEEIKETLQRAEDQGHHKKALRAVVKIRMMTPEQRLEANATELARDQMMERLGMLSDLPLGEAALARHG
jgi:uncharacterized protein (UPF0335 family)